jgi:hypothetical protein
MKASAVLPAAALALTVSVSPGAAQTPDYITAKPDAAIRVFGNDAARRIFSGEYSGVRQQAVMRSQQAIPGFDCPAEPRLALAEVDPYPLKPGLVSWIERYVVACTPRTVRNFLFVLEKPQPTVVELLPGTTNADPRLQRDAAVGATAAVAGKTPQGCERRFVTDTMVASKHERNMPWQERWSYDLCGTVVQVEVTFTPSDQGGTTWGVKLVE